METELCGVKLKNPTILNSGFMGVSASSLISVVKNGAGAVTIKSLGPEPRKGHACPVIATWEAGMINAVGLSNAGIDEGIKEIADFKKRCDAPIIASVFAFKKTLFKDVAKKAASVKPDLIELNISCPNVEHEVKVPFAFDEDSVYEVVKLVKKSVNIPVIVKLNGAVFDIKPIAEACKKAGADAINMGNALGPGMLIETESHKPILHNKWGGVSGPAIKPIALKKVWDVYEAVDLPIIGTGGITTGKDAIEMFMAGASAVGIGTAIYYRGLDVFEKINSEINEWMADHGYKSLKDIIGIAHEN